jgi:uncharacterized protein (TIGR02147 family)
MTLHCVIYPDTHVPMLKKDPSSKAHYSDLLWDELAKRKGKNPSYSLRAFARDLGISAATLSQVLSGKREFKKKSAMKVADRLALAPEQTRKMLSQIRCASDHAGASFDGEGYLLVQEDVFRFLSDWYYFAILNLAKISGSRADPKWIASRLGISVPEAKNAVDRLVRLGFVQIEATFMKRTPVSLTTTNNVPSSALRTYHKQNLKLAETSIDRDSVDLRDISSLTMAVAPEEVAIVKTEIQKFKKRIAKIFKSPTPTEVYTMAIQLFPVTKGSKESSI